MKLRKNPSTDAGKNKREQARAAYARSGEAPLLFTADVPGVRGFKHPELPEGRFCLLDDAISALKALADGMTRGLTGSHRVVLERKAFSKIGLGVISIADAPAYPGVQTLFGPELSATEQVKGLREVVQTIQTIKEAYAHDPTLSLEKANEIVQSSPQPEKVRAVLTKLRAKGQTLHTEDGGAIIMPSSKDLPKSLASDRNHVILGVVSSGFNDDHMQANVRVLKLIDADKSVLQEGVHLRINCSDEAMRQSFLVAQGSRCILKLTIDIPAIPLVSGRMYAVVCNLLDFEAQPSEDSVHGLQKFRQATFDFGNAGGLASARLRQ